MPITIKKLQPTTPQATNWLINKLLPAGELVLLDGTAGVGKSLLAASLAAQVTKQQNAVFLLTAPHSDDLFQRHLAKQQPDYSQLQHLQLDLETDHKEAVASLHSLEPLLEQHHPKLLIVDALESLFPALLHADVKTADSFWNTLDTLAQCYDCTILVLREQGTHQCRAYGKLTQRGTALARTILTLYWHTQHTQDRLLMLNKNACGPVGLQWHIKIDEAGVTACHTIDTLAAIRPGKSTTPVVGFSRGNHSAEIPMIGELLEEMLITVRPCEDVRKHIAEQGFSYSVFREALRYYGVESIQSDSIHYYKPSKAMMERQAAAISIGSPKIGKAPSQGKAPRESKAPSESKAPRESEAPAEPRVTLQPPTTNPKPRRWLERILPRAHSHPTEAQSSHHAPRDGGLCKTK